jgi:O-antigen/teichoic acid export membrane protein
MTAVKTKSKKSSAAHKQTSLRDLAVRGGAYLAARELIGMFIRLIGLVLTLRAVGPADYGIYNAGIAYVTVAIVLAQMGTETYLIRLPEEPTKRTYNEAFTHLLISTLLVTVVSEALTFPLGDLIKPAGTLVPLQVMLLSIPLNVLWAPGQAAIERAFDYRKMGMLELSGDLVLYGVSVPLAFAGMGTWALVIGMFAWQGWLLAGSFVLSGLRYRLAFSREGTAAMLKYGAGISSFNLINTLQQLLVPVVVGTFCGAVGVGYVAFAQRLTNVLSFAQRNLARVGTVAIARARDKTPQQLGDAMTEGTVMMLITTAIPFAGFGLVAKSVIPLVFGSEWSAALPLYVTLAIFMVLATYGTCRYTLFFAIDQNRKAVIGNIIQLVVMIGLTYPLVKQFGPVGFGYATLASLVCLIYAEWAARKVAPVNYMRMLAPMIGFMGPLLAPLIPFPASLLTLSGFVFLVIVPSTRRDLMKIVNTVLGALGRRRGGEAADADAITDGQIPAAKIAALPPGDWIVTGRKSADGELFSTRVFVPPPVGRAVSGSGTLDI